MPGTLMGTRENRHSKNDAKSIAYMTIRFRPWAPHLAKVNYFAILFGQWPVSVSPKTEKARP